MSRLLRQPGLLGLISAILMMATELLIIKQQANAAGWILPIQSAILGLGILISLSITRSKASEKPGFMELFQSGFRHFIAVTLAMVLFTYVNQKQHPEYAKQVAQEQRMQLEQTGRYTGSQLDELTREAEKQFVTVAIYGTVFRYLIMGAVFAAVGSLALSRKK